MTHNDGMIFFETSAFTRRIVEIMEDEEYRLLQLVLMKKPEAGAIVPGAGGMRKIRWGIPGRGKRGGARVVYYWHAGDEQFFMLLAYTKNERDDMTPDQMKALRRQVREVFR